jgi:FtsP/CotA-like multicopper oxidase with cupredoxin domain
MIGGHNFQGMLYNGKYTPEVWRLHAGDILTVVLHNQLSEETTLHFHGLNASPSNNGDNVFLHISPNEMFTYQIKIPEKHIGLFWYYARMHGDFDENRTDVTVKLGDTEEWTILNKDSQYHDFHIHKTGFWLRKLTALTAISTVYATRSVFLRSEMGNRARPSSSFLSPIRKLSAGSCFTATS